MVISYYLSARIEVYFTEMSKSSTLTKPDTRGLIIKEATHLFYIHGVHWVSFQQIAERVHISQPAIYKHFKDKDDLLVACTLSAAEAGRAVIDKHVSQQSTILKKLYSYLEGNLIWLENDRPQASMLLAMYYFSHINPPLKNVLLAIHKQSVMRVKTHLDEGKHQKKWDIKDTEIFARTIHNLLIGEMLKLFHQPEEYSLDDRMKILKSSFSLLLKASPS